MEGASALQSIIDHVFLPPQLPQEEQLCEIALAHEAFTSLASLHRQTSGPYIALSHAVVLLANLKKVNCLADGRVSEPALTEALLSLKKGQSIPLNIGAQNAAILITRDNSHGRLIFETFELSPQNASVIGTKGRLVRSFPANAVAIDLANLTEADFTSAVARTLSTMSSQFVPGMQPLTTKASAGHNETRDTTHPGVVTELFIGGFLGSFGSSAEVSAISKNTRDDVLWSNVLSPWRRSPIWLLVRVALQLTITRAPEGSRSLYKWCMLSIMCCIAEKALQLPSTSSDVIFVMSAKIRRRLQKLDADVAESSVSKSVKFQASKVLQDAADAVSKRWKEVQAETAKWTTSNISTLDFAKDAAAPILDLDAYLGSIAATEASRAPPSKFKPSSEFVHYTSKALPVLPEKNSSNACYAAANLQQMEQWVANDLNGWVKAHMSSDSCALLYRLMTRYHSLASSYYGSNPDGVSIMVLTAFELWVAVDKVAAANYKLLMDYDPGMPVGILQNLLLPFRSGMERLHAVETYMAARARSTHRSSLLFSTTESASFAVTYFNGSQTLMALRKAIVEKANVERSRKKQEFAALKIQHAQHMRNYNNSQCEYKAVEVTNYWTDETTTEQQHQSGCKKCSYMDAANRLTIKVFEEPLPRSDTEYKATLFELQAPSCLGYWRDARACLLQEILKGNRHASGPRAAYMLAADPHIGTHSAHGAHRITLLSQDKPHVVTHYSAKSVGDVEERDIILSNGLSYAYYDTTRGGYVGALEYPDTIAKACTYQLPPHCQSLQRFLFRPATSPDGMGPNDVIASQDDCPQSMTLEEYRDLSSIPLGRWVQWFNILLQLKMPSVDFKKTETAIVIFQCVNQAGPPGTHALRQAHAVLAGDVAPLLLSLELALARVQKNWDSSQAVRTFAAIAARVLSLNGDKTTQDSCLHLLEKARKILFGWTHHLRVKASAAANDADRATFVSKSVEVALICAATFDVDGHHLQSILAETTNASILIQCSIIVQEGAQSVSVTKDLSLLRSRFWRLLVRSYKPLLKSRAGLDSAVKASWSAYSPGRSGWDSLPAKENWATTTTAPLQGSSMRVHYNLLSGELLVNGLPLNQPPNSYREHPLYSRLFGKSIIEVMPDSTPGFQFSAKREFAGFTVLLGMENGTLRVRALNQAQSYEVLPGRLFEGVFPHHFVHDYAHWCNSSTGVVEFRPLHHAWKPASTAIWRLVQVPEDSAWRLEKDGDRLLALRSRTAGVISSILSPLVDHGRIHITLRPTTTPALVVELPSLQLGFSLQQGSALLQSREFRSMSVDPNQTLGTLMGLRNKLVLISSDGGNRSLLLPESGVSYSKDHSHMTVTISKSSAVRVHHLEIDTELCRLKDNGEVGCRLYLAYLHAVTSYCLPDPLTRRTGTEQALSILSSPATRSFDRLTQAHLDMLVKISRLTPSRSCYPTHLRVMQTVSWDGQLSPLSQHGRFAHLVESIVQQSQQLSLFYPDSELRHPSKCIADHHLQRRDDIRSSNLRASEFGAEDFSSEHDSRYQPRDTDARSERAVHAFGLSSMVHAPAASIYWTPSAQGDEHLWHVLKNKQLVHGPQEPIPRDYFNYDCKLTGESKAVEVLKMLPALHRWLTTGNNAGRAKFSIMIWLSSLAFSKNVDVIALQVLAVLSRSSASTMQTPNVQTFRPTEGKACTKAALKAIVNQNFRSYTSSPEFSSPRTVGETVSAWNKRRTTAWNAKKDSAATALVDGFLAQWRCESPQTPGTPAQYNVETYIDLNAVLQQNRVKFKAWYNNGILHSYLGAVENSVRQLNTRTLNALKPSVQPSTRHPSSCGHVSVDMLFAGAAPRIPPDRPPPTHLDSQYPRQDNAASHEGASRLADLIAVLDSTANSKFQARYVTDLKESQDALSQREHSSPMFSTTLEVLTANFQHYDDRVNTIYSKLMKRVERAAGHSKSALHGPRVSPLLFLQQLTRSRWPKLAADWRRCLTSYGIALTNLHRAVRLLKLVNREEDLAAELRNVGHTNWDALEHPDWLLIEIEGSITIRAVQVDIARQMQSPKSGSNAVTQLHMGEGKSSVIVPISAVSLANSSQLVRVVVDKPQSRQMEQMLISKVAGLAERRVYFLPFSRSLKLSRADADTVATICRECMSNGGIMIIQPEYMLSFKLMTLESCATGNSEMGQSLLATQNLFDTSSRDIVDESDEIFSVRFEVIYTMGMQQAIELSPDRWVLIQQVLDMLRQIAPEAVQSVSSTSLEVHQGVPGSFPRCRILKSDAESYLLQRLAQCICDHGLVGLQLSRQPASVRKALFTYLTRQDLSQQELRGVECSALWTDATKPTLLLLRGLIAGGVLAFTLKSKRWRVNYGLASRTPPTKLAVPYRAKDSPSARSEFSHPDVVLIFTSLCYYYDGLTDADLFIAFGHLLLSDQAEIEYQGWVKDSNELPSAFRQLQGINLKDRPQCISELFPALRYSKSAIDYFLSHLVFPKEMKEFPQKITASGWDIGKASKKQLTTGFSGTNDSRCVLPIGVEYDGLPKQKHTNALVLDYLLQLENTVEIMSPEVQSSPDAHTLSHAESLLASVVTQKPSVRVILDVGAQILELDNLQLAKTWLGKVAPISPDGKVATEAVVFVGEDDELRVVDRKGCVETLRTSSYAVRLDLCLIFLDEAHTRGIDLKLPVYYRAAVTLGAHLTKDRLVQACMRMRKLGKGQSVVFYISEEIQNKIFELTAKSASEISVREVLWWSISETFADTRRSMPLWSKQGERHVWQEKLWAEISGTDTGPATMSKAQAEKFLEVEAQSLEHRYRPQAQSDRPAFGRTPDPNLSRIFDRCREFDDLQFNSSTLQEEQERELSPEVEQERQVQRAPAAQPSPHSLHEDVLQFATSGTLVANSSAYMPAFQSLSGTSAARCLEASQLSGQRKLFVTADFAKTVKSTGSVGYLDAFQRSVQWILANDKHDLMILSPFEANELFTRMQASKITAMHLYKPRTNSGYAPLDRLDLWTVSANRSPPTIPQTLIVQLNLFAGQLYMSSYPEYVEICKFLGLSTKAVSTQMAKQGFTVDREGFILKDGASRVGGESGLTKSPISFLRILMSKIRRNGDSVAKTHMGSLMDGKPFRAEEIEEVGEGGGET